MKSKSIFMSAAIALTAGWAAWAFGARAGNEAGSPYTVHEWGTFTSVFGSDGVRLGGMEVEREPLPRFVYGLDANHGMIQFQLDKPGDSVPNPKALMKGMIRPVKHATVRMETPVLYFYHDFPEPVNAKVSVKFQGGTISQWYPGRSGGENPKNPVRTESGEILNGFDFSKPYEGSIEWQVSVEPRHELTDFELLKPGETATWLHPRAPKSNVLRTTRGETESYLFYRGLGHFEQPVGFRVENGNLKVTARENVPWMLVLRKDPSGPRLLWSGDPGTELEVSLADAEAQKVTRMDLYPPFRNALMTAGLFPDEADAMLRTWWHSYLDAPGLRVFWIAPREFTDQILPLEIEPSPEKVERVILGRSEVLTPEFEKHLEDAFQQEFNPYEHDGYFRAYRERVEALRKR